jgi:hypothetical protein
MATPPNPTAAANPSPSSIQTGPNLVSFDPKSAVPQQPIYIQRNDILIFFILTNTANTTVKLNYRYLTPQGEIKEGEFDTAPIASTLQFTIPLYEAWLLSFSARVTSLPPGGSSIFLQASLGRIGAPGSPIPTYGLIWQGFIPGATNNGWPGTPSKEVTDGPGVIRSITGTVPAAGVDINEQVPALRRWLLIGGHAILTASAAVANRQVSFVIDDGANTLYFSGALLSQTAGQTNRYVLSALVPSQTVLAGGIPIGITLPWPLRTNFRIRSSTAGLQAGDQWTALQYEVIEWGTWDN